MKNLAYFRVRQANNGWIVSLSGDIYRSLDGQTVGDDYVFPTLDAMNEWLKEKFPESA